MSMFRYIGAAIEGFRLARGFKKKTHLARAMKKDHPEQWAKNKLGRYENSKVHPPLAELEEILEFLEVSLGHLEAFLVQAPAAPDLEQLAHEILAKAPKMNSAELAEFDFAEPISADESLRDIQARVDSDPAYQEALESVVALLRQRRDKA